MLEIAPSQGEYTLETMQKMATIASTADDLSIEGNNFKVNALTGSPDMVLFACEQIGGKDIQLAMQEDDIERMLKQRNEIDLLVSDLQADRGEDELIERVCSKIIHLIRNT